MRYTFYLLFGLFFITASCGTVKNTKTSSNGPISISKISEDSSYGSEKNPIMVGGVVDSQGPGNQRKYLDLLTGPKGEEISYERIRSCCAFETKNGIMGTGLLDVYRITFEGMDAPVELYINMYDYQTLYAPVGFTIR